MCAGCRCVHVAEAGGAGREVLTRAAGAFLRRVPRVRRRRGLQGGRGSRHCSVRRPVRRALAGRLRGEAPFYFVLLLSTPSWASRFSHCRPRRDGRAESTVYRPCARPGGKTEISVATLATMTKDGVERLSSTHITASRKARATTLAERRVSDVPEETPLGRLPDACIAGSAAACVETRCPARDREAGVAPSNGRRCEGRGGRSAPARILDEEDGRAVPTSQNLGRREPGMHETVNTPRRSGSCDGVIESSRSPIRAGQRRQGECVVASRTPWRLAGLTPSRVLSGNVPPDASWCHQIWRAGTNSRVRRRRDSPVRLRAKRFGPKLRVR